MRLTNFTDRNNQEYVSAYIFIRGIISLDNKNRN